MDVGERGHDESEAEAPFAAFHTQDGKSALDYAREQDIDLIATKTAADKAVRLRGIGAKKDGVVCVFVFAVVCGLPACIARPTIVSVAQSMSLIQAVKANNLKASEQGSRLIP